MGIVRHATASLVTLLAFPKAASSESTWTGPMYVETVTKACVDVGIKPGTRMFVNLSPASLNTESQLSFVARPKVHQIYGGIADFSQGTAYDQTFVIDGKLEVQGLLSLPLPAKPSPGHKRRQALQATPRSLR
jgi:hypothetical protein